MVRALDSAAMARRLAVVGLCAALGACATPEPVVPYQTNVEPLVNLPTVGPLDEQGLATVTTRRVSLAAAGVADGRGRFREIYCAVAEARGGNFPDDRPCEAALHRLMGEPAPSRRPVYLGNARRKLRLVIVPGTMAECFQSVFLPLSHARAHVETLGYETEVLVVSGRSSSAFNAVQIRDYVTGLEPAPEAPLVLLGYSKGAPDILEAVVAYPEVAARVSAVVSFAGAVGGSALIDEMGGFGRWFIEDVGMPSCPRGDAGTLDSLRPAVRAKWLARNDLPRGVRYFSFGAFTERENVSAMLRGGYDTLAQIDPRNDSQVIFYDQVIPAGELMGYADADHWAIAMPVSRDMPAVADTMITRNAFPREVLLEAIVRYVEERLLEAGE